MGPQHPRRWFAPAASGHYGVHVRTIFRFEKRLAVSGDHARPDCWYSRQPIGHSTLSSVVRRMCNTAGISGHRTNHSLRATAATRLFHKGIDEQLIMHVTGHRNTTDVRSYKHISEEQKQHLSVYLEVEPTDKKFKHQQTIPSQSSDVKLMTTTTDPCTQHSQFNSLIIPSI